MGYLNSKKLIKKQNCKYCSAVFPTLKEKWYHVRKEHLFLNVAFVIKLSVIWQCTWLFTQVKKDTSVKFVAKNSPITHL